MENIKKIWNKIYKESDIPNKLIEEFLLYLQDEKARINDKECIELSVGRDKYWYKDVVVYSLYVDLFNKNFKGLLDKLEYLEDLGVNCLWLLPILNSPMKDVGFDISDYKKIRSDLFYKEDAEMSEFREFLNEAHKKGIAIIFDIAMNHCSTEHEWFKKACIDINSEERSYFIWNDEPKGYDEARIIFKGILDSNWAYEEKSNSYYFHRFFDCQPDLNYRNPKLLLEMTKTLIYWKKFGIDGFRVDAVPYLWKEENSSCENLNNTHLIVKFFRAVLDYLWKDSFLLAEACQKPYEVVDYFGNSDECHAAYHFPLMPQIFKAVALGENLPIIEAMNEEYTPKIPDDCQWFTFLRCHDELTLEMVNDKDKKILLENYAHEKSWVFREGEGIAARLSELFKDDVSKIMLAYNIIFSLIGTPIIFYGDEFAKGNDYNYYKKMFELSGYDDARYLCRGNIDWEKAQNALNKEDSAANRIYNSLKDMIAGHKSFKALSRGSLEFIKAIDENGDENHNILAYYREYSAEKLIIIMNLSDSNQKFILPKSLDDFNLVLGSEILVEERASKFIFELPPYSYSWMKEGR